MRKIPIALLFLLLLSGSPLCALAEDAITLNLPESLIVKAVTALLPLPIDAHSKSIQGDILIKSIKDFQFSENRLSCRLHVTGTNLALVTVLSGHEIRLKVGAVEIDFETTSTIRYDPVQQTLFIKPMVKNLKPSSKDATTDIGQALVTLLNGREFPITLQNLDPLIAKSGAKTIMINTRIADIRALPQALRLSLVPTVTTK